MNAVQVEMEQPGGENCREREVAGVEGVIHGSAVMVDVVEKRDEEGARQKRAGQPWPMRAVAHRAGNE